MKRYRNFNLISHPLISHKLGLLRNKDTNSKLFRELVEEITMLMCFDVTRDLKTEATSVETPLCTAKAEFLSGENAVVIPILRAGLGMLNGILKIMPCVKVGHIGIRRNENTFMPELYYINLPGHCEERTFILIDPMLATGGSALAATNKIKELGVKDIKLLCIIAAPEGVRAFCGKHPDVQVYAAALDEHLNEKAYIVPGLGDAGDRIFGTK